MPRHSEWKSRGRRVDWPRTPKHAAAAWRRESKKMNRPDGPSTSEGGRRKVGRGDQKERQPQRELKLWRMVLMNCSGMKDRRTAVAAAGNHRRQMKLLMTAWRLLSAVLPPDGRDPETGGERESPAPLIQGLRLSWKTVTETRGRPRRRCRLRPSRVCRLPRRVRAEAVRAAVMTWLTDSAM